MAKLSEQIATRQTAATYFALPDFNLPNPDEVLKLLGKDITTYKNLLYDPRVYSAVSARKSKCKSLEWDLNKGKAKSREVKLTKKMIERLDVYGLIEEAADAWLYGYKVFEVVWELVDGLLWPRLVGQPCELFFFDNLGQLRYRSTKNYFQGEIVDTKKKFIVLGVNQNYWNPYGSATLSRCYWWVTFKRSFMSYYVAFTEKYGMNGIYANMDADATGANSAKYTQLEDGLKNFVKNWTAILPMGIEIKQVNTASRESADLFKIGIDYFDNQISEAVLTQALTQNTQQTGTYGSKMVGQENEYALTENDRRGIYEPLFNKLIEKIYALNFPASLEKPTFEMFEEHTVNLELLNRDVILKEKFGATFTKEHFINTQGLYEDDFELPEEVEPVQTKVKTPEQDDEEMKTDKEEKPEEIEKEMME